MDWWLGLRHWNVCQIRGCDISGCFKHWVRHPESYHCCFISPFSGLYVHIILYRNLYPQYPQNFYFFIDLPPFKDPEPGRHASLLETGLNDEPEADWIWLDLLGFTCSPGFKSSMGPKGPKKTTHDTTTRTFRGGTTNPTSHLFGETSKFFDGRENRKANSCLLIAIDMGMGQHVGPKGTTELGDV